MSLIDELKRRNVIKVAGAYLALGWVVVQATATLAPAFHLPESALPLVTWIGVIGFPFVVVFSWIYELTPEGLKRESEVDRSQSITHVTSKRLDYVIVVLLILAIGMAALQYLRPTAALPGATREVTVTPAVPAAEPAGTAPVPSIPAPEPVAVAANGKSIAVLPFVNMSSDKEQEYFSDGMSEELLNLLAQVQGLKVIARTSSFAFRGTNTPIAEIAKQLQVAHVLEGSVRKSGSTVRITAQLIRAADSAHLWSDTWDRPLDDIFAVQDEIAGAVVEQLKIRLLGAGPQAKAVDPQAYSLLLQARQLSRLFSEAGFEQGNTLYQQALAIEPDYAAALSGLARNYSDQAAYGLRPIDEGNQMARDVANKAIALDPGIAQAHAALGDIAMFYDGDAASAAAHYQRALALEPGNVDIISSAGMFALSLARLDTGIELVEYAIQRDPLHPTNHFRLATLYAYAGRLDDSIASSRRALELNPATLAVRFVGGVALLLKGDAQAALTEMQQETDDGFRLIGLVPVYHTLGSSAASDAALAELIAHKAQIASYNIAYALAWRGEADRAFEWLDKAIEYHDAGLSEIAVQPLFASIRQDPRWLPFLRKLGKAPEQLAAIKFDVKLPQ